MPLTHEVGLNRLTPVTTTDMLLKARRPTHLRPCLRLHLSNSPEVKLLGERQTHTPRTEGTKIMHECGMLLWPLSSNQAGQGNRINDDRHPRTTSDPDLL